MKRNSPSPWLSNCSDLRGSTGQTGPSGVKVKHGISAKPVQIPSNVSSYLAYADSSPPHLQGSGDTATVTITDDDYVPVVLGWGQAEWSVRERDGAVTLRAAATTTQDRQPEQGFSVEVRVNSRDGTATQPGDYESIPATV